MVLTCCWYIDQTEYCLCAERSKEAWMAEDCYWSYVKQAEKVRTPAQLIYPEKLSRDEMYLLNKQVESLRKTSSNSSSTCKYVDIMRSNVIHERSKFNCDDRTTDHKKIFGSSNKKAKL